MFIRCLQFIIINAFFLSHLGYAQEKVTLIFSENELKIKEGFLEGGVQIELPDEAYYVTVYDDKKYIGAETYKIDEFRKSEEKLIEKYFKNLCELGPCGDRNVSYEWNNFMGSCQVLFYCYDTFISSSHIDNINNRKFSDGQHMILITVGDNLFFQKRIWIKDGVLINQY
jgi:hypothetical protein